MTATATNPQKIARYVLTAALFLVGAWMLRHFLPALAWAVVLAIASSPWYERWLAHFHGRRRHVWAALSFTLLLAVVLIVPLAWGGIIAVRQGITFLHSFAETARNGAPELPAWLTQLPWVGDWIEEVWTGRIFRQGGGGAEGHAPVFEWTRMVGVEVFRRLITLAFTLLTLYFVFLERDRLRAQVPTVSRRIFGSSVDDLFDRTVVAIRATVDGIVIVALAEGAVMGVVYGIAGARHPALLGALTGIFAMVPFAAPVVFGAVALALAAHGALGAGIGVAIAGAVVLFIADHFVRPAIIGGGAKLPFLWVLLGILGGVETFGLIGLFLGPALMAALVSFWRSWASDPV